MVAVGADGGVGGAVGGAAGVVVNDGLIAEIDDVERTIGADAILDGAEPEVLAADELGLLAAGLALRFVGDAIGLDHEVADDVQRGLGGEVAVVPLRGPGTAFINGATCGGGVAADLVDLHIGLLLPMHGGIRRLFRQHAVGAHDAGQLAFGQHILRQHDVDEVIAAGGLRVENLAVAGDVEAPGIAAAAGVLLEGAAVRLEAHDTGSDGAKALAAIAGFHVIGARIAVRGIDPAIKAPAHVVDDGVRVAVAEVGVNFGALVGLVVAVRVFEEPHIGRGADDDAVFVKHAAGGELDLVGEDLFLIHDAVSVRVGEDGDAIERFAVVVAGLVGSAVLPRVHV